MTTGTSIRTPPAVSLNCGTAYPGEHYSKSWSGADQAPIAKEYRLVSYRRKGYWALGPQGSRVWYPPVERTFKKRVWKASNKRPYDEHPYSCTWTKMYEPRINWQWWNTDWARWEGPRYGTITSCYGGWNYGSAGTRWTGNDTNALLGKLREKVAGSSFNAGVFLAEAPQALRMIYDSARRIDQALRYAKRGNFLGAARALTNGRPNVRVPKTRATANNWLELQYGWLPLLSDVYDAASFLAEQYNVEQKFVVRVKKQIGWTITPNIGSPSSVSVSGCQGSEVRRIKAVLREKDIAKLSGLMDPASVLWEKLPYSFVVDWLLPIGSWLEARGLASALTGTFVVSSKLLKTGGKAQYIGTSPYIRLMTGFSQSSREEGSYSRTVDASIVVGTPETVPLSEVFGWRRAANAISLLAQRNRSVDTSKYTE